MAEQVVELQPGELKVVSFEAIPSVAKTYQVLVNGLVDSFSAILPVAGWVSPTSFSDVFARWLSEENAYDGNIGTYCYTPYGMVSNWDPLELRLSNPVSGCDKVRIYCCGYQPGALSPAARISIELYYENGWHEIFSGALEPTMEWVEVTNPAGAKTVSKARIKRLSTLKVYIYEFEFWRS